MKPSSANTIRRLLQPAEVRTLNSFNAIPGDGHLLRLFPDRWRPVRRQISNLTQSAPLTRDNWVSRAGGGAYINELPLRMPQTRTPTGREESSMFH